MHFSHEYKLRGVPRMSVGSWIYKNPSKCLPKSVAHIRVRMHMLVERKRRTKLSIQPKTIKTFLSILYFVAHQKSQNRTMLLLLGKFHKYFPQINLFRKMEFLETYWYVGLELHKCWSRSSRCHACMHAAAAALNLPSYGCMKSNYWLIHRKIKISVF